MNCRPGDLAVVIRQSGWFAYNDRGERYNIPRIGTIVRVTTQSGDRDLWLLAEPVRYRVEFMAGGFASGVVIAIGDSLLSPIRDNDGEDESFRWAPSPEKVLA